MKSTDSPKIVEHFEKGAKFDVLKTREGYFRDWDHQLMQEMYAVTALPRRQGQEPVGHLHARARRCRAPNEDLEVIAATQGGEQLHVPELTR